MAIHVVDCEIFNWTDFLKKKDFFSLFLVIQEVIKFYQKILDYFLLETTL